MATATELYNRTQSNDDAANQQRRQVAMADAARSRSVANGSVLPATGILAPGSYKGSILPATWDVNLTGLGVAVVTGTLDLSGKAIVKGVTFNDTVALRATANAMFTDCIFLKPITVAAGGVIGCVGCRFDGTSAITHTGPAANANRVGCVGTSALPGDGPNVTVTGGI